MKRLLLIILLILGVVTLIACDDDNKANDTDKVSYIFVQEATEGSLISSGEGSYTLNLNNVTPYTIYFSERPQTIAGNVPMQLFIDMFPWESDGPPNAAIVLQDATNVEEDTLVVQLFRPVYDTETATLSYNIKPLQDYDGNGLAYFHARGDASLPESFSTVSLYIDDVLGTTDSFNTATSNSPVGPVLSVAGPNTSDKPLRVKVPFYLEIDNVTGPDTVKVESPAQVPAGQHPEVEILMK